MRSWLLVVSWWCCACGSSDAVDRRKCTELRDHLIGVRLASAGDIGAGDIAQHRAAMKQALGEGFISQCEQSTSLEELRCELKATDLSSASACSHRESSR